MRVPEITGLSIKDFDGEPIRKPLVERIGRVLRKHRLTAGMSLARVSAEVGISLGYLSQIELGNNTASIDVYESLAARYGLELWQLLREAECEVPNAARHV